MATALFTSSSPSSQLETVQSAVQTDTAIRRDVALKTWIFGLDTNEMTASAFNPTESIFTVNFADVFGFNNIRGAVVSITTIQLYVLRPGPIAAAPTPNAGYSVQIQMRDTATKNRYAIRQGSSFFQSQNLIRASPVLVEAGDGAAVPDVYEWKLQGPLPQSYIGQSMATISFQVLLSVLGIPFGPTLSRAYITMRVEQVE